MILRMFSAAVAATGLAVSAEAAIMDFDYVGILSNYSPIPQTEGDIANLDVTGSTRDGFGNAAEHEGHVEWWNTGYASPSLVGVAFASANGRVAQYAFDPAPGYTVTLTSFDVGTYSGGPSLTGTATVYDSSWNVLWTTGTKTWSGAAETEAPGVSHAGTIYLQWGQNWNIGVDNIVYDVAPTTTGVVPLPAPFALLAGGLAALGIAARRRG